MKETPHDLGMVSKESNSEMTFASGSPTRNTTEVHGNTIFLLFPFPFKSYISPSRNAQLCPISLQKSKQFLLTWEKFQGLPNVDFIYIPQYATHDPQRPLSQAKLRLT